MRTQHTNHGAFLGATQPDPYAELKKAHAEGKKIEYFDGAHWNPIGSPSWSCSPNHYRIKPESTFQLPPPPPGMQWHRTDGWREGDLPQGMRPMVIGEPYLAGDEYYSDLRKAWSPETYRGNKQVSTKGFRKRTRRPLTFTHAGKTWTWHRPGDAMPCERDRLVTTLLEDGEIGGTGIKAYKYDWNIREDEEQIIGWRYADEKKTVPLGPEDVRCGDEVQFVQGDRRAILRVTDKAVEIRGLGRVSFLELQISKARIRRRDSDAWEPCSKEVLA